MKPVTKEWREKVATKMRHCSFCNREFPIVRMGRYGGRSDQLICQSCYSLEKYREEKEKPKAKKVKETK